MAWVTVSASFGVVSVNGGEHQKIQSFSAEIGEFLNLHVIPDERYYFDHWLLNGAYHSSENPVSVQVTQDEMSVSGRCLEGEPENGDEDDVADGDGLYPQNVVIFEDEPLKTETWEQGKRKTKEVRIPTEDLVHGSLEWQIAYSMGNEDWIQCKIILNGRELVDVNVDQGGFKSGAVDVTHLLEGSNVFEIWHGSSPIQWGEAIFDVLLKLKYSSPQLVPGTCPFPIIPRLGLTPISDAPILCGIWGKVQDLRVGQSILRRRTK